MAESNYVNYVPRWAQNERLNAAILDDTPNIGIEPPYAPRLSTRLVPAHGESTVSGLTLIDTVLVTQKILTYSAQEAAFGVQFEFADLRSVESSVEELARMRIEPFEEGSFVIPAVLDERSVSVKDACLAGEEVWRLRDARPGRPCPPSTRCRPPRPRRRGARHRVDGKNDNSSVGSF